mmetsp:Transcript_46359/g.77860  ORF Transcript_46359/g.77860 Transcript_46359/m.77860 type:complete len:232 (+) Transcript_46359:89-784(+)
MPQHAQRCDEVQVPSLPWVLHNRSVIGRRPGKLRDVHGLQRSREKHVCGAGGADVHIIGLESWTFSVVSLSVTLAAAVFVMTTTSTTTTIGPQPLGHNHHHHHQHHQHHHRHHYKKKSGHPHLLLLPVSEVKRWAVYGVDRGYMLWLILCLHAVPFLVFGPRPWFTPRYPAVSANRTRIGSVAPSSLRFKCRASMASSQALRSLYFTIASVSPSISITDTFATSPYSLKRS